MSLGSVIYPYYTGLLRDKKMQRDAAGQKVLINFKKPLARNPGSCIICGLPFSEVRKAAPPAGRGPRRAGERSCRDFVNRLTGDASPCKVFPCAAREGGGAGSLPRNLDNRILRMEFERRTITSSRMSDGHSREQALTFIPVRGTCPDGEFSNRIETHIDPTAPPGAVRTESLILAQDERWRRA